MRVDSWALTDVGRARKHNEDGWLIDDQLGLYAVADGMGGHAAGEVASAHALRVVQEELVKKKPVLEQFSQSQTPELRAQILREVELAINVASSAIFHMAQRDKKRHGMGTTLSMVLVVGGKAFMAHVGDSRVYLATAPTRSTSSPRTTAYLWEQVKKGAITARGGQALAVLQRDHAGRRHHRDRAGRHPGVRHRSPATRTWLCSDGMHGYVESEAGALGGPLPPKTARRSRGRLISLGQRPRRQRQHHGRRACACPATPSDPSAVDDHRQARRILRRIPLFRHLGYKELVKVLNHTHAQDGAPRARTSSRRVQ
jgi:serine/threonine protein phosphatase PrpC